MQMGLCARPIPRSTTKEACADVCQAYRCVFFTVVSQGTAEAQMQKRLRNTAGQKGDAWKKQLATVTGVKYKPEPQQEDSWEDSTGVYDTDGNQLSLEGISEDDNDDDVWVDDFEDDTGVTEDKEIFNMDTGWSIQDFQGVVQQPPERQVQHSSRSPLVYYCSTMHQHLICVLLGIGIFCVVSIECSLTSLCCACTGDPVRHLPCLSIVTILHSVTTASYCLFERMRRPARRMGDVEPSSCTAHAKFA